MFGLGNLPFWIRLGEEDEKLSGMMQRYWVSFAETGDPNGEGLPSWPAHTEETDIHLEFGDRVITGSGLHRAECDLFHRLMMKHR